MLKLEHDRIVADPPINTAKAMQIKYEYLEIAFEEMKKPLKYGYYNEISNQL